MKGYRFVSQVLYLFIWKDAHCINLHFPIHFATGYSAQKLGELITFFFFIIIYKVIYLQRQREREKEWGKGDSGEGGRRTPRSIVL